MKPVNDALCRIPNIVIAIINHFIQINIFLFNVIIPNINSNQAFLCIHPDKAVFIDLYFIHYITQRRGRTICIRIVFLCQIGNGVITGSQFILIHNK